MDGYNRGRGGGMRGGRGGHRPLIPKADRSVYDGKSKRAQIVRKAVDLNSVAINYVVVRQYHHLICHDMNKIHRGDALGHQV